MHEMDSLKIGEVVAVSRYWTPKHVDVTSAPLNYAKPKAAWLKRLQTLRLLVPVDDADRMRRRALNRRTIVDPTEIRQLPPLDIAPDGEARRPTFEDLRARSRDFLERLAYR